MNIENDTKFDLELFFSITPDLLCIAGFDGHFKKINPSFSKLLGYSIAELLSRPIHSFIHPQDFERTKSKRKKLLAGNPLLDFENRYITKEGTTVWLSWTSIPVASDQVIFAIAKDITYKKTVENSRNALLTNLTKINTELKQLTYMTAHDLRSPVSNLLSIFSLIDISKVHDQETLELIDLLNLASIQLKETLDDYVDQLSEKHRGHNQLQFVDLNQTLQNALLSVDNLVKYTNTEITVDFSEVNHIWFSTPFLYSVFLNLISNSIKYTKPDRSPEISIISKKIKGYNQIIFRDKGRGFDLEKVKARLFGIHQKFDEIEDGKGIGLYLVNSHMENLGGKIEIESEVNKGATFTLFFKDCDAMGKIV